MTDYPLLILFAVVLFSFKPWRGTRTLVSLVFVLVIALLLAVILSTSPN